MMSGLKELFLNNLPSVSYTHLNKFVDCAISANAHYIVTNDHHYDVLKDIDFPKVNVVNIQQFLSLIHIFLFTTIPLDRNLLHIRIILRDLKV